MRILIKTLSLVNGKLFVISAGKKLPLANFSGRLEIIEWQKIIPMLGKTQMGMRTISASFIVGGDLEYCGKPGDLIHSGNVF